mgnify:CR=1 FL=1
MHNIPSNVQHPFRVISTEVERSLRSAYATVEMTKISLRGEAGGQGRPPLRGFCANLHRTISRYTVGTPVLGCPCNVNSHETFRRGTTLFLIVGNDLRVVPPHRVKNIKKPPLCKRRGTASAVEELCHKPRTFKKVTYRTNNSSVTS